MKTIDYNLQRWTPKEKVWTMGNTVAKKGYWQSVFLYKSIGQARRELRKFNHSNFVNRGNEPWRMVKITKETVH